MKRLHKTAKIQQNKTNGQYSITIPSWLVEKVLVAKKGDVIDFDFEGLKLILKRRR